MRLRLANTIPAFSDVPIPVTVRAAPKRLLGGEALIGGQRLSVSSDYPVGVGVAAAPRDANPGRMLPVLIDLAVTFPLLSAWPMALT